MIQHVLELAARLRSERFPLVARQGDFWARNLLGQGRAVSVVDWEHAQPSGAPFADLFMFITSYGLSFPWQMGHWAEPTAAFRATYLQRTWLSKLVRQALRSYCRAMQVSPALLEVFFPVFLVERALEEREQLAREPRRSTVRIWRALVLEYARQGGSVCFE